MKRKYQRSPKLMLESPGLLAKHINSFAIEVRAQLNGLTQRLPILGKR